MKKLALVMTLVVVFTMGTINIASAKPGKDNPGQAKKQQVTIKVNQSVQVKLAPGQAKKSATNNRDSKMNPGKSKKILKKALPSVIKIGRLQLPVNPIIKDLGAKVTWELINNVETIKITKEPSIIVLTVAVVKSKTEVTVNATTPGGVSVKVLTQKGNGVINPTSYIKSLLKVTPAVTVTPTPTVPPTVTPTPTPTVSTQPTITDKKGLGYNGQGLITLPPVALTGDSYVYAPIQNIAFVAPLLGTDLSAWSNVVSGDTITFGASAALANGKHLGIAEVNTLKQMVRFFDITVSGIVDYVPATSGQSIGSIAIENDTILAALTLTQNTSVLTFTVDSIVKNYTINSAVVTKTAFLTDLNTVLAGSAVASFDTANKLKVVSNSTGITSTVVSSGLAKSAIVGTPIEIAGTAAITD
jgi:hypothetical protein